MPILNGIYYSMSQGGDTETPPVVLLHGIGGSSSFWHRDIRRMHGYRVCALDLPGHGKSGGVAYHSIAAYAERVVDFFADIGFYETVLVGHDMGGAIALTLAARYQEQVAGLGLISSGAFLGGEQDWLNLATNSVTFRSAVMNYVQRSFAPGCNPGIVNAFYQNLSQTRSSVLFADWKACADFDIREVIQQLQLCIPSQVIQGIEDTITPPAFAHFLSGNMPRSTVRFLGNTGHQIGLEQPDVLLTELITFLKTLTNVRDLNSTMKELFKPTIYETDHTNSLL